MENVPGVGLVSGWSLGEWKLANDDNYWHFVSRDLVSVVNGGESGLVLITSVPLLRNLSGK